MYDEKGLLLDKRVTQLAKQLYEKDMKNED
jgi:hypothetical protein